ncbi:urease accessory protein UreE [Candidatus Epulonipiscium viviparus]|uniref:urease accessory protein UreE n=1 Tax=Candidatus Epulonipiscium viviparus TaxID=420336 RepID=UPI000689D431|nr:urease accessory protein UreE [Candidatus Epulopiscium viviparus]
MLIEKVIGNIEDYQNYVPTKIEIEWHERHKRIIKKGDIAIRFDDAQAAVGLKTGDVLATEGAVAYVVEILPAEALIINVPNAAMVAKVCYEIGNRHAPLYKGSDPLEFYTTVEEPIKVLLEKLGVAVHVGEAVFTDQNMISGSAGHSHSHDGGYDGSDGKLEGKFYAHTHKH